MKKLIIFLLIAIFFCYGLNSKPIKTKKSIEPDFVKFWTEFQNIVRIDFNNKLEENQRIEDEIERTKFQLMVITNDIEENEEEIEIENEEENEIENEKENEKNELIEKQEFIQNRIFELESEYEENFNIDYDYFEGISYRQIFDTKVNDFIISKNGIYIFDPWVIKKEDPELWKEKNIIPNIPVGKEMYLIEYRYGGNNMEYRATNTLIFSKINGKYQLIDKYFTTYD